MFSIWNEVLVEGPAVGAATYYYTATWGICWKICGAAAV